MGELHGFNLHPMCKPTKLIHLVYVDDLMIFYKGQKSSIRRVVETLSHCSQVNDLEANMKKSNFFEINGPYKFF